MNIMGKMRADFMVAALENDFTLSSIVALRRTRTLIFAEEFDRMTG